MVEPLSFKFARLKEAIEREDRVGVTRQIELLESAAQSDISRRLLGLLRQRAERLGLLVESGSGLLLEVPPAIECGEYFRYPNLTGGRRFEGGKRIKCGSPVSPHNNDEPPVTIVTVVFNNAKTIEQCIESVLAQTYSNIEYIVIDGGSTDGTVDVLESYQSDIDYILSEPDQGIYDAMNKGLSLAKGEYIAFLNADDFYFPGAVEDSIWNIRTNGLDLSYAGFFYADENGVAVVEDEAKPWDSAMYIQGLPGGHETLLAHRKCYNEIGGYNTWFKIAADYDWYMRAYQSGFKGAPLQRTILVMRPGGASFEDGRESIENTALLKKMFGDLTEEWTDFLYGLKYYKNWHGLQIGDIELSGWLEHATEHSEELHEALSRTIEQRKQAPSGLKEPALPKKGDKRKIAIVVTFLKDAAGGAERIAIESANALSRQGHGVTIVCCQGTASEPFYQLDPDVPVIDVGIHPWKQQCIEASQKESLSYDAWAGREYPELDFCPDPSDFERWNKSPHMWRTRVYEGFFRIHNFDAVISHMPSSYPYVLLARPSDDKALHIASLHNSPKFKFYSRLYPAENDMERYMRLVALEKADAISILFDEYKSQLPECFRRKAFTLPNFTSPKIVSEAVRNISVRRRDDRRIVSVGRLAAQKDHETLLRAYALIKDRHPDWSLAIYGSGPLDGELRELADSLGLDGDSIFRGDVRDIAGVYAEADIFAFPSKFEGFPLTLLEAMTFGLPIVGFRGCEGVKYLISSGEDGLLVDDERRVQNFAQGLSRLVSEPSFRDHIGRRARRKADGYTVDRYVEHIERLIGKSESEARVTSKFRPRRKLKVALLSTFVEGGAGIAMRRLKQGLNSAGVDAKSISFSPGAKSDHFQVALPKEVHEVHDRVFSLWKGEQSGQTLFSASYPSIPLRQLDFLKYFDVINLHWVQRLLSNEAIAYISRLGPPVVWTMHDMNPFTGGCHYSAGCKKYETDCVSCPQVVEQFSDYPGKVLLTKGRYWGDDIVLASPSRWLADCARQSRVFRNNRIRVIPNGLDIDVFRPYPRASARAYFDIPEQSKVMLFSCQSHGERRKGFLELIRVAEFWKRAEEDVHIVTFGHPSDEIDGLGLPHTSLGHIQSAEILALGYSAADVTLLPTLEDNLPNVILESVACGTPVVGFASGGVPDAVIPGVTGEVVERGNCQGMANSALQMASEDWTAACRGYAKRHMSLENQARGYIELFETLIQEHSPRNDVHERKDMPTTFPEMRPHLRALAGIKALPR